MTIEKVEKMEQTTTLKEQESGLVIEKYPLVRELLYHLSHSRHTLFALFTGIVVWELLGRVFNLSFLPPFSNVIQAGWELVENGQVFGYLAASLVALVIGYGLAVISGVMLGLLMGRYRWIETMFDWYINAFLAAPKIIFVPVLYAIFGLGRGSQVAVVFLSAFFIIVINTMSGIRNVEPGYVDMARSYGASERQLFWKVLLPGALPLTMAGLRLGIGRGVKGMIKGEMFIAVFGMGALLRKYGSRFDSEKVFAILLILICVVLVSTFIVRLFERRVISWTGQES